LTDPHDYERKLSLEYQLASRIRHPNVARYIELVQYRDRSSLIMEWIEGRSVAELFAEGWQTSEIAVGLGVQVVLQALRALRAVHDTNGFDGRSLGWVHGDVSPHNLMVDTTGTVKLVDLGIARVHDARTHGEATLRASFVAPELARGERVDRAADVYSLGAILYLLTTGWHPYAGAAGPVERRDEPPLILPSSIVHGYPDALERLVLRALAPQREHRFQSTAEMFDELIRAFPRYASQGDIAKLLHEVFGDAIVRDRTRVDEAREHHSETHASEGDPTPSTKTTNTLAPSYVTTELADRSRNVASQAGRFGLVAAAFVVAFVATIALSLSGSMRRSVSAARSLSDPHPSARQAVSPRNQSAHPNHDVSAPADRSEQPASPASARPAPALGALPTKSAPTRAPQRAPRQKESDSIVRRYGI
jgi:serine/threonine protein kinase